MLDKQELLKRLRALQGAAYGQSDALKVIDVVQKLIDELINDVADGELENTTSVGARLGTTVRVIITDGGDCTVFEWQTCLA